MTQKFPRVSVGLPVYNGENFLVEAIDSILGQTYKDFELIISDNHSTDRTEEICRKYEARDDRVKYYRAEKNMGASWNFNRVVELASGEYFQWMAHDDVLAPTFIEKAVAVLDSDPTVVLAFSKTKFINEEGKYLKDYNYQLDVESYQWSRRFVDLIVADQIVVEIFGLMRADVLWSTLPFGSYVGSDRVMLGELSLRGRFHKMPEPLFYHREHSNRSTKANPSLQSRLKWFDTSKKNKICFPSWKLLVEHLKSIRKSPLTRSQKIKCIVPMLMWIREKKKRMIEDLIFALRPRVKN
ncbi:glycosyltransferase family 2 protein [Candidatus Nitronereus thalassa]|uniref:Glycosyltransferase family 2 protein n=1 Tax=Candidatus Nitronereus thalassa TaxID=3020898 RepID=A0ABU3K5C7_9BACT|nr:glycosyltransferase family 2 protein [Candidatus Nitronereus thalassa]MDT7041568.1 glycosyltransferase family 2 protein [Candidatus Nitronereus thalassa]